MRRNFQEKIFRIQEGNLFPGPVHHEEAAESADFFRLPPGRKTAIGISAKEPEQARSVGSHCVSRFKGFYGIALSALDHFVIPDLETQGQNRSPDPGEALFSRSEIRLFSRAVAGRYKYELFYFGVGAKGLPGHVKVSVM